MEYRIIKSEDELYHYGVKGMRWGKRKARSDYASLARTSRESAREWDEMAKYAEQRGKTKKAAKYRTNAAQDRADAKAYERQAVPKKKVSGSTSSPKQKVATGKTTTKKSMQKIAGSTVKGVGKLADVGLQVFAHSMRVQGAYNQTGHIFDQYSR